MPDSTDAIIRSILETADRDHWTAAERLQALALIASDRPAGKPAVRSASFWLLLASTLAAGTVAVCGAIQGNPTAAAVGAGAAAVGAVFQVVRNSGDKRADGSTAARKLEAVMSAPPAPPPPAIAADVCETCHGTKLVYTPDEHGKVEGTKPCPACQGSR